MEEILWCFLLNQEFGFLTILFAFKIDGKQKNGYKKDANRGQLNPLSRLTSPALKIRHKIQSVN